MVEDRSFEGIQPRLRRRRAHPPRYIRQGQRQGDLHFHGKRLQGGITPARPRRGKHLEFPRRPARLSIRAPRNFYYRARGAREGPPIYSNRRFRKFCLLRDQGLSHRDSSAVRGVLLVFEPRGLYSSLKYVKLDSHTWFLYTAKRIIPRYQPCSMFIYSVITLLSLSMYLGSRRFLVNLLLFVRCFVSFFRFYFKN